MLADTAALLLQAPDAPLDRGQCLLRAWFGQTGGQRGKPGLEPRHQSIFTLTGNAESAECHGPAVPREGDEAKLSLMQAGISSLLSGAARG